MSIDRNAFSRSFISLPSTWLCGYCRKATLVEEKDPKVTHEWEASVRAHGHPAFEPDWVDEAFAAFFSCPDCNTGTVVSGKASWEQDYDPYREFEVQLVRFFKPMAFTVAPATIAVPIDLPESIDEKLRATFPHIWSDPEACGGSIRRCVEAILDDQKIKKRILSSSGKYKSITTHHRIEQHLPAKLDEAKPHLMALKWIGNNATHNSKRIHSREELLDAFEHLEEALISIYGTNKKKVLAKRAKDISARKGRPTKSNNRRRRRPT
jgi:hypothetical protein